MDGIVSFGNKRDYEDFKKQLSPQIIPIFDLIRDFCFSLGDNVIEDVRMHRIVFCKSITFRWFLDMEPENDSILLKIQKNIYFCFIEYAKNFDCVDCNKLWKILQVMGIPDHLTCLLRNHPYNPI